MKTLSIVAVLVFCMSLISFASKAEAGNAVSDTIEYQKAQIIKIIRAAQGYNNDNSASWREDHELMGACCEAIDAYEAIDCRRLAPVNKTAYLGCIVRKNNARSQVFNQCGVDPSSPSSGDRSVYQLDRAICLTLEISVD